jgi:FlaA1/EpsC-like NDP-sugar epimerase
MKFPGRHTPRWLIFLIDVLICAFSLMVAFLIRFEFHPPKIEITIGLAFFPLFLSIRALSFFIGKTFAGIIRYTSTQDAIRIFTVITSGSVLFIILNLVRANFFDGIYFVPMSIIFIEYLVTLFLLIVTRIAVKVLYVELKTPSESRKRVVIYGAGESGLITKRTIDSERASTIQVVAFLDDDPSKSGKKIEGSTIYHTSKAEEIFEEKNIEQIIISIQKLPAAPKAAMINKALRHNIQVLHVPPVKRWIKGELSVNQIREIQVEDLLGRAAIRLNSSNILKDVEGKRVLVTGAAGSIGGELARQLAAYGPASLVLLDQAETPMFELEYQLSDSGFDFIEYVIGDVRNKDRMKRLFDHAKPQIVYHAAAYKHVPLMESNPSEAVLTNTLGTKHIADLCDEMGVERMVLVSTDKAVNPTNVMGATKRVAEIYVQSKNTVSKTNYITTRFGNVLGSNGSVIPLFKKQIASGGPMTVTHKDVTRYFMTIPEAVQLVLEAGAMGQGGEIFVFDMGESIRIYDLAVNMIKLSGLELGKDIEIKITGLRPGEKLFEELLNNEENTIPTHHDKILKATVREYEFEDIGVRIDNLISLFDGQNNERMVEMLKELVPEYRSENSEYSKLDH